MFYLFVCGRNVTGCVQDLRTLKLKNCHWVTHGSIESLAHHQAELEEVDLTSCWDLGDTAIIALLGKFRK